MKKTEKKTQTGDESGFSELIKRFKEHPFIFGGTVILLLFIIIAFVFLPTMPSMQNDGEELVFGYYNGKPITRNTYFNNVLRETAAMMNFDLQSDYAANSTTAMQVWYQAFVRTFINMAILDEMKNSGYSASVDEINRIAASRPEFQEDGKFSMVKYNNYGKTKMLALLHNIEEEYITGKFFNDFMGLKISTAEKNFIGAMAYPERTYNVVSFPRSSYPESEVLAFASGNQDLFKTIHLSRITMSSEKEARLLLESIQSGKISFEDAARNHSTDFDKDKGGDMGRRMAYEIFTDHTEENDRKTITSLGRGEISPLFKTTNDSWVFYRAEEAPSVTNVSLAENLEKINTYMDRFEGGRIENWLVALVEELLNGAKQQNTGFAEYVLSLKEQESSNLPVHFQALAEASVNTVGPFSLNFNNMGGAVNDRGLQLFTNTLTVELHPELYGAAESEVFWRNAFSTPLNTPSAPFSLGYSIIVLIPIEENFGDEESTQNIANFYQWGFMYNAIGADVNGAFLGSDKLENNFYDVFMPILFGSFAGSNDG